MRRIEIDEAQHELERAALQLEAAAERCRVALESEWAPLVADRALRDARDLHESAGRILSREAKLAGAV